MHQSWDQICSLTLQIIEEAHAFAFHTEFINQMEGIQEDKVLYLLIDWTLRVFVEFVFALLMLVYAQMI